MRIRPICVVAILSWGLARGAGVAHGQGFPAYAPNGYPPPGYGMPYGPPPGSYGYPNPGFYAPPPGAMPNPYGQPMMAMPPGAMPQGAMPVFPGYANYPGVQARPVPAAPAALVPSSPAGTSSAGTGQAPTQDNGNAPPAGETLRNLPTPVPQTTPVAPVTPPTIPAPATPSEPLISFLPDNFLQPFQDHGPNTSLPPHVTPDRAWFTADYLMGFARPEHTIAPLVTTSSTPTSPTAGAIGDPGTSIVVGDTLHFNQQSGFRLNAGFYVDNNGLFSVEGDGMYYLPSHFHSNTQSDATGNPIIARPIFDVATGSEMAYISSQPAIAGLVIGGSAVDAQTQLYGFEINGRYNFILAPQWRADLLFGFRYMRLLENLIIRDNLSPQAPDVLTFVGNPIPAGDLLNDIDNFNTKNDFYGLQIGGRVRWDLDWLSLCAYGKFAVGPSVQQVSISGQTMLTDPTAPAVAQGGVLALPSNSGVFRRTVFDFIPEAGLNVAINVTQNVQVMAGYSFLMWTLVVRPGAQIDHNVNPSEVPSDISFGTLTAPAAPTFRFNGEVYWIHSINVGINIHF